MRIMFVGDISLGEYYTSFGHGPATYLEHGNVFNAVKEIFDKADIIAGNLEAALTTSNLDPSNPESVVLRGHPKHAKLLREAGFKVLQLANNHTVQHGQEGFDETVRTLEQAGICPIGLNNQPLTILKVGNKTVGFFAASDVPDNTNKEQTSYQRLTDTFLNKIRAAVDQCDHLFVMFHWGLEASTTPMDYQIKITQDLLDAGVRGVIGSHPHLFYETWVERNGVAAPSLGNFVFDLCWDERLLKTGILDIEIDEQRILNAQVWPVFIQENGCLPFPAESPVPLTPNVKLYDLGPDMSGEQTRKLKYFFSNFFKGNRLLKAKFIIAKFSSPIWKALSRTPVTRS